MTRRPLQPSAAVPPLVLAAHRGLLDEPQLAALDRPDPAGVTPLVAAAAAGHLELVTRLLALGASPTHAACDDTTALLAALAHGHDATASLLLPHSDASARITQPAYGDDLGALRLAAATGAAELFGALVAAGATPAPGELALLVVRRLERDGRRVVLRGSGRDPTRSERYSGGEQLPDLYAVDLLPTASMLPGSLVDALVPGHDGDVFVRGAGVRFVLDPAAAAAARAKPRNVPVAAPVLVALELHSELCSPAGGARRRSALELAAQAGLVEALLALAPGGAELARPLVAAARWDRPAAVDALLTLGADASAAVRGETVLGAAISSGNVELVARLLQAGASPDGAAGAEPPLLAAARSRDPALLAALVAAGADLTVRTPARSSAWAAGAQTALHVAIGRAAVEQVRSLLEAGAPLEARDAAGRTPLHALCARVGPPLPLLELLLAASPDLEARDAEGLTPLLLAVRDGGGAELVERLFLAGARRDAAASDGSTLNDLASRKGNQQLLALLLRHSG